MKAITRVLMLPAMALLTSTASAELTPASRVMIDIETQPMVDALSGWAHQTGMQLTVPSGQVAERLIASPVRGYLTPLEALSSLLQGTPLSYDVVNNRTVVVHDRYLALPSVHLASLTVNNFHGETEGDREGGGPTPRNSSSATTNGASQVEDRDLEEVVVTAQKRAERLQDVPISISVLSGDSLDRATVRDVTEALNRVPGVTTATNSAAARSGGYPQIIIRGVVPSVGSSTTAYYLDSIPFGTAGSPFFSSVAPDPSSYDLERVEVLRGPQGTLYGLSASNGVVRVLTKDANLSELEAKARGSVSSTDHGGRNYRGDLSVNLPLIEDKLAARAVIGYQDWSGWIDKPFKRDANDAKTTNARLKVNAQPTDELSFGAFAWLSRSDIGGSSISPDGRRSSAIHDDPGSSDYDAYGFTASYDFPSFSVTSMTSYLDYRLNTVIDYMHIGIPNVLVHNDADSSVFSEEIILNSNQEGGWRWTLGGIYRDGEVESFSLRVNALTGGFGPPYLAPNIQRNYSESSAIFGELTKVLLGGKLELTAGVRYFEDEIKAKEVSAQNVVGGVPLTGLIAVEDSFDSVTPRVVVSWRPDIATTIYASYGEGFRSGLNQSFSTERLAPGFPSAKSDLLKNYEIGTKGSLWSGRLSFDTAVYYMDWEDVQQSLAVVITQDPFFSVGALINAVSASGPGFDFSTTLQASDGITLTAAVSWNDLEIDKDVFSGTNPIPTLAEGERLGGSPETTANASAEYAFPVGGTGYRGRVSAGANYISKFISGKTASGTVYSDSMVIARSSFEIESSQSWTATLFVDNVTNENGVAARDIFSPQWYARVRPRTIGMQLDYRF